MTMNRKQDEAHMVEAAERDLVREFPLVPQEQVHTTVQSAWHGFESVHVRDFVPLLVRRKARDQLRARTAARAAR
jgi:hypothetical protein